MAGYDFDTIHRCQNRDDEGLVLGLEVEALSKGTKSEERFWLTDVQNFGYPDGLCHHYCRSYLFYIEKHHCNEDRIKLNEPYLKTLRFESLQ